MIKAYRCQQDVIAYPRCLGRVGLVRFAKYLIVLIRKLIG